MFKLASLAVQYLLPHQLLNNTMGRLANSNIGHQWAIKKFISHFNVDLSDAELPLDAYKNFNEFFTRKLKHNARPVCQAPNTIVSPVDGTISQIGAIQKHSMIQAKGLDYTVNQLLGYPNRHRHPFYNGQFTTLYLSPRDYHRVHMPVDGLITSMRYIPGKLFAVKPLTANNINQLFTKNERLVMEFETAFGHMAIVMVGAMIVSGIHTQWLGAVGRHMSIQQWQYPDAILPDNARHKGSELGHFELGSTVILLFSKQHKLRWQEDRINNTTIQFGQPLATITL